MSETADCNRQRILEAARETVGESGVYNTTLRQIAARAGISNGALYYYYRSKDLILYDLMDESTSESQRLARRIREAHISPEEMRQEVLQKVPERVKNEVENRLFFHLAMEAILGKEELRAKFHEKYRSWIDGIEDVLVHVFQVPKTPVSRAISQIIEAAIDGFSLQYLLGLFGEEQQEVGRIGRMLLEGEIEKLLEEFMGTEHDSTDSVVISQKE